MNDYEDVIRLWREAGLPYKPQGRDRKDNIEIELKRGIAIFLIAEKKGNIVGTVLATHDGRKGWINRLAVKRQFRRMGIAKALIKRAERELKDRGIHIIACLIEEDNQASIGVFNTLGYKHYKGILYFTKRESQEI